MSQAWRSPFLSVRLSEKATTAPLSEWSGLEQGDGFKPAVRPHSLCARRKRQRSRRRSELLRAKRIAKNAVMALERDIGSASSRTTINQSRPFRVTFLVVAERFAVGAQ